MKKGWKRSNICRQLSGAREEEGERERRREDGRRAGERRREDGMRDGERGGRMG